MGGWNEGWDACGEALTLSRFKSKAAFPVLGLTTTAGFSSTSSPSSPRTSDSSDGKSSATAAKRARPLTCRLTLCQVRPPASALPPHGRARPAGKGRTEAFFVEVALAAPRVSDESAGATSSSMEAAEVVILWWIVAATQNRARRLSPLTDAGWSYGDAKLVKRGRWRGERERRVVASQQQDSRAQLPQHPSPKR